MLVNFNCVSICHWELVRLCFFRRLVAHLHFFLIYLLWLSCSRLWVHCLALYVISISTCILLYFVSSHDTNVFLLTRLLEIYMRSIMCIIFYLMLLLRNIRASLRWDWNISQNLLQIQVISLFSFVPSQNQQGNLSMNQCKVFLRSIMD